MSSPAYRSDRLTANHEAMQVMLRAADVLADLVHLSRTGDEISATLWTQLAKDLEALNPDGNGSALDAPHGAEADAHDHGGSEDDVDFAPAMIDVGGGTDQENLPPAALNEFKVRFRCTPALYEKANEPAFLLRELRRLGQCTITCSADALPAFELHGEFGSHLSWEVLLATEGSRDDVRDVFEFVEGDCLLEIEEMTLPIPAEEASSAADEDHSDTDDEDETPAVSENAGDTASAPPSAPDSTLPLLETAAASDVGLPPLEPDGRAKSDLHKEAASASATTPSNSTIRVELERVDRLINLVGELVINQAMLAQRVIGEGFASSSPVMLGLDELEQLTREIQESVMAIRAQPVKPLFQRMSRIVREVCNATGKNVRLKLEGDTTEVDKTVIERLADPLTHMIRNAVDHGIESAEVRAAAGKPLEGTVRLSAAHRSGRVVIEISDDGAGLNRKRILEKAKSKGLIPPEAVLSESEIDNLLFLPGFSTAETVSSISGRGVGMDVVRRSIQALGGRISIASTEGKGSSFSMSLPLTLAILDGMIVSVAGQTLVVPLTSIVETFKPPRGSVHSLGCNASVVQIRDTFVPVVDVGQRLGFSEDTRQGDDGVAILVETEGGGRHALLVEGIQDQRQVVIKSLETNYGAIEGIAAATILGDGRVALILDVEGAVSRPGTTIQSHIAA